MNNEYITIYAIIPSEIYKTKNLTPEDKLIAERITALCSKEGYAWITNKYLANMFNIRIDTVSKHIKRLEKYGYIKCSYSKKEKNTRRVIYLTNNIWDKEPNYNRINNHIEVAQTSKDNIYNNKKINNIPKWIEHPELCRREEASQEEIQELEELLKEFKD